MIWTATLVQTYKFMWVMCIEWECQKERGNNVDTKDSFVGYCLFSETFAMKKQKNIHFKISKKIFLMKYLYPSLTLKHTAYKDTYIHNIYINKHMHTHIYTHTNICTEKPHTACSKINQVYVSFLFCFFKCFEAEEKTRQG